LEKYRRANPERKELIFGEVHQTNPKKEGVDI